MVLVLELLFKAEIMNNQTPTGRLTWAQIKDMYRHEWVELTDFRWDSDKAHPTLARVRNHSPFREDLISMIEKTGKMRDTIILYLGMPDAVVERDTAAAFC